MGLKGNIVDIRTGVVWDYHTVEIVKGKNKINGVIIHIYSWISKDAKKTGMEGILLKSIYIRTGSALYNEYFQESNIYPKGKSDTRSGYSFIKTCNGNDLENITDFEFNNNSSITIKEKEMYVILKNLKGYNFTSLDSDE